MLQVFLVILKNLSTQRDKWVEYGMNDIYEWVPNVSLGMLGHYSEGPDQKLHQSDQGVHCLLTASINTFCEIQIVKLICLYI